MAGYLEDLLQVGVVGGEAVVRRGAAAEEQAHRVALVPERGLHPDEDLAILLPKHQQLAAVGVQLTCASTKIQVSSVDILLNALVAHDGRCHWNFIPQPYKRASQAVLGLCAWWISHLLMLHPSTKTSNRETVLGLEIPTPQVAVRHTVCAVTRIVTC